MTILIINPGDSRCDACGGNADPKEHKHLNENMWGEGCGAVYTQVSSDYFGLPDLIESIKHMRPDLEYVGWKP